MPRKYWRNPENVRKFLDGLKTKLGIQTEEDWYRLSLDQIRANGGAGVLKSYSNSIVQLLQTAYPETPWERWKLSRRDKRSMQRLLFVQLQRLFPSFELVEDFLSDDLARLSGKNIQFDVCIPSLRVGFEYHGKHHYQDMPTFGFMEMYKDRDEEKESICAKYGFTLVVIPYWSDLSLSSLRELTLQVDASLEEFMTQETNK